MNKKNEKKLREWSIEERDRFVSVFKLLLKMDKKQNPEMYKPGKNNSIVVLDKAGRKITL